MIGNDSGLSGLFYFTTMPYAENTALPDWVREQMPETAQTIYRKAFNAALEQYGGDEGTAARVAITAVKNKYEKRGERYVAKEGRETIDTGDGKTITVTDQTEGAVTEQVREIREGAIALDLQETQFVYGDHPMIKNVSLFGLKSKNGYRYIPEGVQNAVPLYEGARMYFNHLMGDDHPAGGRDVRNTLGKALNVRFDGVPLQAVFDKAVAGAVIQWQNGPGRGKYDEWSNGQVINIDFKSPGATAIDPKQAMIAQARSAGVDVTDKQALMTYIMSQIEGMN